MGGGVADVLPVEEFARLRVEGWSYKRIAERVGVGRTAVQQYGKEVLPAELRRAVAARQASLVGDRVVGWSYGRIARMVGWSIKVVNNYGRQVLPEELQKAVLPVPALVQDGTMVQCRRCQLLGEEKNPIGENGLCLWCRLEQAGMDLRWCCESGLMRRLLGD